MEMTGDPDGPPTKIGPAIGDWVGSLNAFGCIGTALYYREKTGKGQFIDISLSRSLLWMAAKLDHTITGEVATRSGNHHSNLAPYGIFNGNNKDAIILGALSAGLWSKLCEVIKKPELAKDPRFISNDKRVENRFLLVEILEDWLRSFARIEEPLKLLLDAGIPSSKVYNQMDIDADPHYNECGWLVNMPLADGMTSFRTRRFPSNPMGFTAFSAEYKKAPALGEHNHELIGQLGYTAEEVDAMEAEWLEKAKATLET
jgi:formyl-CoA transferase